MRSPAAGIRAGTATATSPGSSSTCPRRAPDSSTHLTRYRRCGRLPAGLNLVLRREAEMRRFGWVSVAALAVVCAAPSANATTKPTLRQVVAQHLKAKWLSQGVNAWLNPPRAPSRQPNAAGRSVSIGSNVDAADVNEDLLGGQSETAIAASASGRVVAAWNDATGFAFLQGNRLQASLTGVGYSADGGRSFTDLVGLRNPNPDQQWAGDPTVV